MADNFSAHCYMMPLYDRNDTDSSIRVSDNKVQVVDQGKSPRMEFNYDNIFSSQHDFIKSSFTKVVSPLIKQTVEGESTMVLFGGLQSLKMNEFLLSHTVMQGLISQAAGQLLNSVNDGEHKVGSVTFSWFKVECASQENLVDVLKTASSTNPSSNSSKDSLVLRELGKGRGMVVPGLWEVEIAGGGDIEAVINHLQKIVPDADHSAGNAHTVMQLTVTNQQKASKVKPVAAQKEHSALGTVTDGPGVGRISFVLLANMSPSASAMSAKSPKLSTPATPKSGFYPWVEHARVVMQWLESRRASTPFHKSRLLLLLKDVLLRRQKAAVLLMLQPSIDQHNANVEWLKLISQITADHTAVSSSLGDHSASQANLKNSSTAPSESLSRKPSAITVDAATLGRQGAGGANGGNKTPRSATPLSRTQSAAQADFYPAVSSPMFGSPAPRSATPQPSTRPSNPLNTTSIESFTPRAASAGAATGGPGSLGQRRASMGSSVNLNKTVERRSSFLKSGGYTAVHEFGSDDLEDGPGISETEKALQVALEASQSESAALKLAYQYSSEKYAELKGTYEDLLEQLKEEGAFLVKRDRERFRAALKDLKDYEIYKEVMEAAMVRMQQELEVYAEENATIRTSKEKDDRNVKKHREFNDKYAKDLVATKKKLSDAQARIAALEKQVKQVNREREVAVTVLAQFKSSGAQMEGQTRMQEQLRAQENEDLHRRLRKAEERVRALETDKDAILASNAAEAASLRAAHSKALEMLMGYQEENDLLRSAVNDRSESKGQGHGHGHGHSNEIQRGPKPPAGAHSTTHSKHNTTHSTSHTTTTHTSSSTHAHANNSVKGPDSPPPLPPLPPSEEDSVLSME